MERILTTMTYTDQPRTCRDCGNTFSWTAGEQEFYASRGLTNPPSRCPECRAARKSGGSYGGGGGGGNSYSRGGGGGYTERGPREMHEAVCDSCGGVARVPFVPRGDKPVYCSDCFSRTRGTRY
jgi:CxxC-x17-CxxC domain-containing protein